MKKIFLFLVILFSSFLMFSQSDDNFAINIPFDWLQVDRVGNNYEYGYDIHNVHSPSFIITKTVENTKNGYLYKIWVASNTVQNGAYRNIQIDDISVLYYGGYNWISVFDINFTIIGGESTLVTYFYNNDPNLQISFQWYNIKIN